MTDLLLPLISLDRVPTGEPAAHQVPPGPRQDGELRPDRPPTDAAGAALQRWVRAVLDAPDACLVVNRAGVLVAVSAAAALVLGLTGAEPVGRRLLDATRLVDFETGEPAPEYAARVAPLLAVSAATPHRALLRVAHPDGRRLTVDAVAAPVHDPDLRVVGAVCFLAVVTAG